MAFFNSDSEIPAQLRANLKKTDDGRFEMDDAGVVELAKFAASHVSIVSKNREAVVRAEKAAKELQAKYDGIDPERHRELEKAHEEAENAKLSEQERIEKNTAAMQKKHQHEIGQAATAMAEYQKIAEATTATLKNKTLHAAIRAASNAAGVFPNASDEMMSLAVRSGFGVDDSGEVYMRDSDGDPVFGSDGKSPMSLLEWMNSSSLKEDKGFLYAHNTYGGGAVTNDGAGQAKSISMEQYNKLSHTDRRKHLNDGGLIRE